MKKPKVILIAGPTGVGKTAASVHLAKKLDTDIISCDSMQIYRGMDIGTAKVTPLEAQGVVHHMTDIVSVTENFSVCDYVSMASKIITKLDEAGKVSIVVGGTGLYADSLLKGIDFDIDAPKDTKYRQELSLLAKEKGNEYIHSLLCNIDPVSADKIHPNNVKRVIRALEYYKASGERISDYNERTKSFESPYDALRVYFTRDRKSLYNRIDKRVDKMIEDGLLDEVKEILNMGLARECTAMQALGYKEIVDFLENRVSFDEAVENIKTRSRRYAKRQLTWFRRDLDAHWLNLDEFSSPEEAADKVRRIYEETI